MYVIDSVHFYEGGAAAWCIDFQKLQGHDITILGGCANIFLVKQEQVLESFHDTEFWYAEQGSMSGNLTRSGSMRRIIPPPQHTELKLWLPVLCLPSNSLSDE
ncbi:hypothetical protein ACET3Z_010331 [Daucus carota]